MKRPRSRSLRVEKNPAPADHIPTTGYLSWHSPFHMTVRRMHKIHPEKSAGQPGTYLHLATVIESDSSALPGEAPYLVFNHIETVIHLSSRELSEY